MRMEEQRLHDFMKENSLVGLNFSWGTNKERHYFAFDANDKEVHICYNTESGKIVSRMD